MFEVYLIGFIFGMIAGLAVSNIAKTNCRKGKEMRHGKNKK